ncbi:MAG: hypothetical protein AAGE65_11270 [Planctomycetota bacterium]
MRALSFRSELDVNWPAVTRPVESCDDGSARRPGAWPKRFLAVAGNARGTAAALAAGGWLLIVAGNWEWVSRVDSLQWFCLWMTPRLAWIAAAFGMAAGLSFTRWATGPREGEAYWRETTWLVATVLAAIAAANLALTLYA